MRYNRVLTIADYDDLPRKNGHVHRKQWEVSMALATIRDHVKLSKRSTLVLGAGAGHEATIFHLSNDAHKVYATDLYKKPGVWANTADATMLTNPARFAPEGVAYDLDSIVVEHADMTALPYEDGMFHAIFSSGSIEHVGTFDDVALAAAELGRVLRPGGVLSLSTEWKISGDGSGWPGVLLFDEPSLYKYIIEPSGCDLIDEPALEVDSETLEHTWPLERIVYQRQRPDVEAVIEHAGYLFTSVHIALRKPKKRSQS